MPKLFLCRQNPWNFIIFDDFNIKTVLDYGSGRGSWEKKIYNEGKVSASEYFKLDKVYQYEPTISNSKNSF